MAEKVAGDAGWPVTREVTLTHLIPEDRDDIIELFIQSSFFYIDI